MQIGSKDLMLPPADLQAFAASGLLAPEDLHLLRATLKPVVFKKGTIMTAPGDIQRNLYVVQSGVQMAFLDSGKKTHVVAFTYAPQLCGIPESFFRQKPSVCFLTCLTDSTFYSLSFEALQSLFDESHKLERLFRILTEELLSGVIGRHLELHALTMEERFRAFCKRSPHLLQIVPHKHLASYLGIDATNFSKLFNSIKI